MRRAALAALTLAASAGIPPVSAQDAQGPQAQAVERAQDELVPQDERPTLAVTLSQSAVADTNYNLENDSPGTSFYGDSRVSLDFLQQTRSQVFGLGLDTGLRSLWEAEEDFEFVLASPSNANLDYLYEGADLTFDAALRARSRRVDYLGEIDDTGALPDDITPFQESDTTELRSDADIGLAIGTNSPSTYEFRLLATDFAYSEETGRGGLVPRRSVEGQATWSLRLTPVLSSVVFGSYYYYTSDDNTDNEVRVAEGDIGLSYEPSENLRVRGGLGYADRTRDQTIGGVREETQHDTGPSFRGDFRYVLPSLTLFGNARVTTAAPQTRVSGVMSASYLLPRGRVTGRVFQRYGGGTGGDDSRITGAGIGLTRDLNDFSRLDFDASYATQVNLDDDDDPDINRTDLTASFIYDLTEMVSAEVGYGYRHRQEDPDDADSHRLFMVIGRTFETGL